MLSSILLGLLIADSVVLIAAILFQAGKGGGLAANFGGVTSSADAILGTRQAGNILTKLSWWCGGIFLGLAFILSLASTRRAAPRSVLDQTFAQPPAPTAPISTPQPATNVLPIQTAPTGDAKAPATKAPPTKTP